MSSIRLLRTFVAVAAEGSFAAAAPRVALTQAAVGQQMRLLESEMRRALFARQGKAVVLSDAGRELLPQVRRLVALYDQMLATAPATEPMAGTLNLGAVVSAVALSLIMNLFTEPGERARAMGVYGFVCAGGGSIGVLLGGVLTSALSWHWIFLVNIPVGV
eukprot:gene31533-38947_t